MLKDGACFLVREPGADASHEPTAREWVEVCAGYMMGVAVGQLLHIGASADEIRAKVEEIIRNTELQQRVPPLGAPS